MKYQISCLIVIIFCITYTLNTACDDAGMTSSALCTANTTCEWKENTTAGGTCGDTTTNSTGGDCTGAKKEGDCDGNCVWDTSGASPACVAGTKTSSDTACTASSITTKAACNGKCTWTGVYYCTEKTVSPTNDPAQGSGFGLKNSILIALGFFLF